jgi:hypothetical protein
MNMACQDIGKIWYFRVDLPDLRTATYLLAMP